MQCRNENSILHHIEVNADDVDDNNDDDDVDDDEQEQSEDVKTKEPMPRMILSVFKGTCPYRLSKTYE